MSTVVGTVFLMLIILMVASNVLLWSLQENSKYNQAVLQGNQEEADHRSENIVTSNMSYAVDEDNDQIIVEAELKNAGPQAVQIVNLWAFDTTTQKYGFNDTVELLNLNLNPGGTLDLTDTNGIKVIIDSVDSEDDFSSWFVTARGSTIPLQEEQLDESIIVSDISRGIGYLALESMNSDTLPTNLRKNWGIIQAALLVLTFQKGNTWHSAAT